jgi:DNA polymerase-3 subunit alpha
VAQEVLMCVGAGRNLDENRGSRIVPDEFWFKDEATIRSQFPSNAEAIDNTLRIAEKCNFSFKLKDDKGRQIYHLPDYKMEGADKEVSVEDALRLQTREGLKERFKEPAFVKLAAVADWAEKEKTYWKRLEEELDMIVRTGFSGYFLVVSDFIKYAKSQSIPVGPGRGSGAGSLVAYSLKITDIDPIPFNLLFERFINPERVSMPDFDVDFCQDRRQEVIDYVVKKYGREKVAQIITFGKLLARGVIRDVGRVMGLSYGEVDAVAKLIPEELGITLEQSFERESRLRDLVSSDPRMSRLFEVARALEGLNRHASVHAAGVVITNRPLVEYCPLYAVEENETVVQFDKDYAEKIGLVKFDFLGLKTLTVIDNAVKFVRETQNRKGEPADKFFQLELIDYSDPKVFELISAGDTDGIFQLESSGMKDLCQRVQPNSLEDITAINALYRPGPLNSGMVDDYINRKHGKTPVVYELPQLADILEETYGVIVYQEQVMRVARVLANYSLGEADILRRAMGKKKPEEMAKQRDKFLEGCKVNSIDSEKANRLFDLLAKFAEYGFNKSHSAAYGVLSYQTAFLKTYYPAEFMAALMATEMDNTDKMSQYIADSKAHAIEVLPPNVNESKKTFSVVEVVDEKATEKGTLVKAIRFGLEAIKGVGGVAVDAILLEREAKGPFTSFIDFCKRVTLRKVNKKVIESLISAGAFDTIAEQNRATLFESVEGVIEHAAKVQEEGRSWPSEYF